MIAKPHEETEALTKSLNALGYKITPETVEIFLHISKLAKEKGLHVTLAELTEMKMCVNGLFEK